MKRNKQFFKKRRIITMTAALIVLCGLSISLLIYLALISPGKPAPCKDGNGNILKGSISEKIFVPIGGVKQGMFIISKNTNNPVLLYLHGGPGFPNYFLIDKFNPGLEDFFTVCYWEQRGGGLSFTPEVTTESMTLTQLTSDAIDVTNYLRKRFGKKKIYLLAHSGGTVIGLSAVSQSPELYHSYITMAQITNQAESEKIAYEYMLKQFIEKDDQSSIKELKKFRDLETYAEVVAFHNSVIRDRSMHELGIGTMRNMNSVFWDIFIPVWTCRAYTLKEKFNIWKSKLTFLPETNLTYELLATNFAVTIPAIDIPVYFINGKYDFTVNVDLSRNYFQNLNAPLKRFYTFENSAHSPLFEEAEHFRQILINDVLQSDIISEE